MSLAQTVAQIDAILLDPTIPSVQETLDALAAVYVDLESRAAAAYAAAWVIDEKFEDVKLSLLAIIEKVCTRRRDGSMVLAGDRFEARVTLGASNYFDPEKVKLFRGALLRARFHDVVPDIFIGRMIHEFRPNAAEVISRLPAEIRSQVVAGYEACRSRTPILSVSRIP